MNNDTTDRLEEKLVRIRDENELYRYLDDPDALLGFASFPEYFLSLDRVAGMAPADLVRASGIDRTYCYQILNGTKPRPGRDKIIRLCIAAGLTLKETMRALKTGGEAVLYARNRRDAVIIYCIEQGYSCEETDILLDDMNERPLM
ncbi:MAG: helix-turn-helix domain-containing protein [Solobacterium sp.]|nr:helix-turn-helix domain-containing protein [Solobacterium sp.]